MRVQRLLAMSAPEMAERGRQETWKWLERSGLVSRRRSRPRGAQEAIRARFFEGAADDGLPRRLKEAMQEDCAGTIEAALAVGRGRFNLLGYRGLDFGDPVDWHLDPVTGRRSPLVHWSRLNPLDPDAVGDCKLIWELNRHQWLVTLGQAYRLTGDERLGHLFARHVRSWLEANPPGVGINWSSSLEISLRLMAWSWALVLFRGSAGLTDALFARMLAAIADHAAHVERYPSTCFSPNTHLTGEALGLFYAGVLFPELEGAGRWRAFGARVLAEQIERQVLPDGVHFELSTCYHRYTLEICLHFLILALRNGMDVPPIVGERVRGLLDFLLAIGRGDGSMPPIGDADGGWLLPLASREPGDLRGLFATAAALLRRPDCAWAAAGAAPETAWLLGAPGLDAFEALHPEPPAGPASRLFDAGGYAVMRDGWEPQAHRLIFDVGPLGCPISAAHGHADLLSIQCAAFGETFLLDAGTGCYTPEPKWRDFFRSSFAHSTVVVDRRSQVAPSGPFSWHQRPRAHLRRWISTDSYDFADADHDAYAVPPDPVLHRRRVLFLKRRCWVIADDLWGAGEHEVEIRFQFAPMEVTVDWALRARARAPGRVDLHLRPFGSAPLEAEVREGDEEPAQGWISPDYGRRERAPVLVYRTRAPLPLRVVTLLFPAEHSSDPPPAVAPLPGPGVLPAGIVFEEIGEIVRFTDDGVVLERR